MRSPRRPAAAASQLCLPLADPRLVATLEQLDRARALVSAMLEGTEPVRPLLSLVSATGPVPAELPAYIPPEDHRIVLRRGRPRKDGTRSGVRLRRRLTVYLDPQLAEDLETFALVERSDLSEVVEQAVRRHLEIPEAAE